jgi:hypothetical protein
VKGIVMGVNKWPFQLFGGEQTGANDLVGICADCHKIRDEQGRWHSYSGDPRSSGLEFTHGFCPDCLAVRQREVQEFILSHQHA